MKNFILIGSAGYIAERHMKAIKETGNNLICAFDLFDVMGKMDNYFPDANFFTSFKRFAGYVEKYREHIDYCSICTPNDTHIFYTKVALHYGLNVICEKPLALSVDELKDMQEVEENSKGKVNTILQLRHHPKIIELKKLIDKKTNDKKFSVNIEYITSRGKWYHESWKGNEIRSGGIVMNIGIHLFDMLIWLFGDVKKNLYQLTSKDAKGKLTLENADINWHLSIDRNDLPEYVRESGARSHRLLSINNLSIDFSDGFTDLHTISYQHILDGKGYGINDVFKAIELVNQMK